jgi:hypothetical protein
VKSLLSNLPSTGAMAVHKIDSRNGSFKEHRKYKFHVMLLIDLKEIYLFIQLCKYSKLAIYTTYNAFVTFQIFTIFLYM